MPLDGAPDFQAQSVQTVSAIQDIVVNTVGPTSTDIANNLQPYHQCLLIYWKAAALSVGAGCLVSVTSPLAGITLGTPRLIPDGGGAIFVVPGQLSIGTFAGGCNVVASTVSGGPSPLTGDLLVLGLSHLPEVLPQANLTAFGTSLSSGAVVVGAGLTATVLAAPTQGTYNRLKCLSWRANVAPGAAAGIDWIDGTTLAEIALTEIAVANAQSSVVTLDWITTGAVRMRNPSTIGIAACVAYENYPI